MSTAKDTTKRHTPLPWAMVYGTDGHHHIIALDGPVADVKVRADADEQDANANILLAVPELLEAARLAVNAIGTTRDDFGLKLELEKAYLALRVVIAKAEGR